MSSISAGTTTGTGLVHTSDTTGDYVIKTGASATTAMTISGTDQSVTFAGVVGGVRQINSISASVGASALTISASALSLDFRSATIGSGTVTTVSGTPSNLVISSGSTLGSGSAVLTRLVVYAINNAGTIELAVANHAGGPVLSETGLISTTAEGGAGGADSLTTAYSTTARSSVAYRVLGYIEYTQATAGTYATAPSLIQGMGAQALEGLKSQWYTPVYAAGDFTASSGSWTVDSGDVVNYRYSINGKTMTINWYIGATSTSGSPANIRIALPAGKTANGNFAVWHGVNQGGGWATAALTVTSGQAFLTLYPDSTQGGAAWTNVSNVLYTVGSVTLEIN